MRRWQLAVIWCSSIATGACDNGLSRDESQLSATVIGTYIARNAGTGIGFFDDGVVQRLLELGRQGRTGSRNTIVNEAVAMGMGHVCNDYSQLQPGLLGCVERRIPVYVWKSPQEIRKAAESIGFTCEAPQNDGVECSYHSSITQYPVRFSVSPSIDGVRSGPNSTIQETAYLHFKQGRSPVFNVVESSSR